MDLPDYRKPEINNRFHYALQTERMTKSKAAMLLGIPSPYLSKLKDKKQWIGIPAKAWRRLNRWEESGDTIAEYATKGHFAELPIKEEPKSDAIIPEPKAGLIDLRVDGLKPTDDALAIQQRIDKLVAVTEQSNPGETDDLKIIGERIDILKKKGYLIEFTLKLMP